MEFGDTLPNGATVVDYRAGLGEGVVLARVKGVQSWVTWRVRNNDPATTCAGHYFYSLAEAVADYDTR
jgi:hypothetical protein